LISPACKAKYLSSLWYENFVYLKRENITHLNKMVKNCAQPKSCNSNAKKKVFMEIWTLKNWIFQQMQWTTYIATTDVIEYLWEK